MSNSGIIAREAVFAMEGPIRGDGPSAFVFIPVVFL